MWRIHDHRYFQVAIRMFAMDMVNVSVGGFHMGDT